MPLYMRKRLVLGMLAALSLLSIASDAAAPNIKGKISGQEKLVPEVYAEAAKPDSRRWTWREPSPSVAAPLRTLSANPSRDLCIAAMQADNFGPQGPILMSVTGGRVFPTTIVVTPGTELVFKNFDPFKHRLFVVDQPTMKAEDLQTGAQRTWGAPGPGRYEVRDELFPSVRTFIVVDPQVAQIAYPGRDGIFSFSLPGGDYVLKAFFAGKQVGKPVSVNAKDKLVELKDPLDVSPNSSGADGK
ncbi:MAG: hypothetical protein FWD69_14000 [Polyangiaceae bacterium]|nr:hypothetical protein [Polyangiaceae bacterium]